LPDGMPTFRPIPVGRNNWTQQIANFPVTLLRTQACAAYPGENRFLSVLFRTIGPSASTW
jgi:hypothetical protein